MAVALRKRRRHFQALRKRRRHFQALRKRRRHFQVSAETLAGVSTGSNRDADLRRVLKDATSHDVTLEIGHAAGTGVRVAPIS